MANNPRLAGFQQQFDMDIVYDILSMHLKPYAPAFTLIEDALGRPIANKTDLEMHWIGGSPDMTFYDRIRFSMSYCASP